MEYVNCNFCQNNKTRLLFVGKDRLYHIPGEFKLVQCLECGLIYLNPRPDVKEITKFYPQDYFLDLKKSDNSLVRFFKNELSRMRLNSLKRILPKKAKILEIGCANGEWLAFLRDAGGYQVKGVELNSQAVEAARKNFILDVFRGSIFEARFPDEAFDLVEMKFALEHMHDPMKVIEEVKRILKPGGCFLVYVPNVESLVFRIFGQFSHGYEIPRHLYDFSAKTIRKYFEKNQFKILFLKHDAVPNDWIYSIRYLLEEKLKRYSGLAFFNISNPLLLALFTPLSFLSAILSQSGRINLMAKK